MNKPTQLLLAAVLPLAFAFQGCSAQTQRQIKETLNQAGSAIGRPTDGEVASGLRQALTQGANTASALASKENGFFKNARLFIPFPPEAQDAASRLRQLGLGNLVDQFVESVNRGAEKAAKDAAPIFINAITSMSISDAWGILRGNRTSATDYLKRSTTAALTSTFRPTIQNALNSVSATKYWTDITTRYNQIPLVTKVNTDLTGYVTGRAIQGLFVLVADEESRIRENPVARSTELMRKVFGYQGN